MPRFLNDCSALFAHLERMEKDSCAAVDQFCQTLMQHGGGLVEADWEDGAHAAARLVVARRLMGLHVCDSNPDSARKLAKLELRNAARRLGESRHTSAGTFLDRHLVHAWVEILEGLDEDMQPR